VRDNYLHRPYLRKSTLEGIFARSKRTPDGRFIDPNTGRPIDGPYDVEHKRDFEFWRMRNDAEAEGLTQREFNDRLNHPKLYQIENPSTNRSRRYEAPR